MEVANAKDDTVQTAISAPAKEDGQDDVANAADVIPQNGTSAASTEDVQADVESLINGALPETQSNGDDTTLKPESTLSHAEKRKDGADGDRINDDRPSKRVQEGQRWNNRPRRYDNKYDERMANKKNNKFDASSRPESNDPVAIRKQVRHSPCRRAELIDIG